jgi:hypothetical protein
MIREDGQRLGGPVQGETLLSRMIHIDRFMLSAKLIPDSRDYIESRGMHTSDTLIILLLVQTGFQFFLSGLWLDESSTTEPVY